MTKTPFLKLYEPKNPLFLKGVSKPIRIRPLNNVSVTLNSIRKKISLDLPEIDDDIGSPEPVNPEVPGPFRPLEPTTPRPSKPLEPIVPRPLKPPEPENKPLEPMFRPPEELIKPIDSLDPDEIQLDLIINLYYQIKAKIFKKKLNKNSSTPNTYK